MEKSEGDRLKCVVYESTLSTAARSPFPNGEGYDTRASLFSHCQNKYTHMWKNNIDGQSLPRVGKVASGASRIGFQRYEKERGNASQAGDIREYPIHRCAVLLPHWGRQRGGGFAVKKEANPASLRSAAPSKGRGLRGYTLLPMEGGAPKGRRLDGKSGMKKSEGDRLKSTIYESTLSTAGAVPLPQWGRQRNEDTAFLDTTPSPRGEGGERSEPDRVLAV